MGERPIHNIDAADRILEIHRIEESIAEKAGISPEDLSVQNPVQRKNIQREASKMLEEGPEPEQP